MKYLIIVDMQNDFLTGPLGNEHCRNAIPGVRRLIKEVKNAEGNELLEWDGIFLTQDTHFENYEKTLEGQKLPVKHCILGTEGWKINKDIEEDLQGIGIYPQWIQKPTFGSYQLIDEIDTRIYSFLNDKYLAERFGNTGENLEFHVCGVCTSICVLANVVLLRAKWPDAKIIVHADACGDVTPEMHKAALVCFKSQQCEVVGE